MIEKMKDNFLFGYTIKCDDSVKAQVLEANRKFTIIWSVAQILFWGYCLLMSTRKPDYMECRNIYTIAVSICVVTLLLAVFVSPKVPKLTHFNAIAVDEAFLLAGMAVAMHLAPRTILIFASVLCVPVFFIYDNLPVLIMLIINAVIFIIAGRSGMDPETYSWTLNNLIIFSTLGLTIGYFVNRDRFERFIFADSAMKLAELQTRYAYYDQMTGLQNRRAYSEITDSFTEKLPSYCCVVMADINGLKEANDNLGHDAGDELIKASAECLRRGFAGVDTIYRIGGDEFSVVITDASVDAGQCIKRLEECCAGWKGEYINSVSISCGFADSKEFSDIDSIEKAADERMYQAKRNYYISSGTDRRSR